MSHNPLKSAIKINSKLFSLFPKNSQKFFTTQGCAVSHSVFLNTSKWQHSLDSGRFCLLFFMSGWIFFPPVLLKRKENIEFCEDFFSKRKIVKIFQLIKATIARKCVKPKTKLHKLKSVKLFVSFFHFGPRLKYELRSSGKVCLN